MANVKRENGIYLTDQQPFNSESSPEITHYRIRFRKTSAGNYQRHEWLGTDGYWRNDDWIASGVSIPDHAEMQPEKLAESVKVSNMRGRNGKEVPNQFLIETESGIYFQSYKSIVAVKMFTGSGVKILLDRATWDYSQTTGKYRNDFLGEKQAETVKKIKSGEYTLADLN